MTTVTIPQGTKLRLGKQGYMAEADTELPATLVEQGEKQTTRMLKVSCPHGCMVGSKPYTVRMARATMAAGLPFCGMCAEPMAAAANIDTAAPED